MPAATGRKENLHVEAEAQAEGDIPSTKDNLQTGGGAVQVAMEAYRQSGKNNGEVQELPKTLSLSEDHQERKRRRLQGADRSLRERH